MAEASSGDADKNISIPNSWERPLTQRVRLVVLS